MAVQTLNDAATACWRAGCDEEDGPRRIEQILGRFLDSQLQPLKDRIKELEYELTTARLQDLAR